MVIIEQRPQVGRMTKSDNEREIDRISVICVVSSFCRIKIIFKLVLFLFSFSKYLLIYLLNSCNSYLTLLELTSGSEKSYLLKKQRGLQSKQK